MVNKSGSPSSRKQFLQFGFTLMELIISMAILAIVTGSILGTYTNSQKKARDARRKSDLKQLQNALEAFANDHRGLYPSADSGKVSACPAPADRGLSGTSCVWGTGSFLMTSGAPLSREVDSANSSNPTSFTIPVDQPSVPYELMPCIT